MNMEERTKSTSIVEWRLISSVQTSTFWIGLFGACYFAALPMSGTIAFRNVSLFALCICLVWTHLRQRSSFSWPVPLLLWAAYLLLFPIVSDSPSIAVHSLLGQWGKGLLAMLAGAGVAAIFFGKKYSSSFHLGLMSSVPILIHLALFSWRAWETSSIPWGYWGRESHHADLGYAAGQSVVLLSASMAVRSSAYLRWASTLVMACLLSTALANSRAGLVFALGGAVLVGIFVYIGRPTYRRKNVLLALVGLLVASAVFVSIVAKEDNRWSSMTSELMAGFLGDAIQIECEGTSSIESKIISHYGPGEKANSIIASVDRGDGARVVLFRAGIALALKHPLGSDGSRFSYQNLLKKECADPAILMAHAHNGWIDTVLALGWAGGVLYLIVLSYFFVIGYRDVRRADKLDEWAIVLVALASFWIFRGSIDSVFKDHMLEMQGFVLSYAAANLWLKRRAEDLC